MWTPAHIGIVGNERSDRLAKEAIKKQILKCRYRCRILTGNVWKEIKNLWEMAWDNEVKGRHLYKVQNRSRYKKQRNKQAGGGNSNYKQNKTRSLFSK